MLKVEVRRTGRRFDASAQLELAADLATVWGAITDYPALPGFMPGIRACRVVQRTAEGAHDERLVVEQEGEFRFLVFAQSMKVTLDIHHQARKLAVARATRFDLGLFKGSAINIFEGRYELTPLGGRGKAARVLLGYSAVIGLRLPPPPGIGNMAVQQNLSAQLDAVGKEVLRRAGSLRAG